MQYSEKQQAKPDTDVIEVIKKRWSPRAFSEKSVEKEKLRRIFEAARWAASSYNGQPWRFIVGEKGTETYNKILSTFVEFNQNWAKTAPVLIMIISENFFEKTGKENKHYAYDSGAAAAFLTLQAAAEGLYTHQMAGFDEKEAQEVLNVPDKFQPFAAMALGYIGDPNDLPEDIQKKEDTENVRKDISEIVWKDWGKSFF